MNLFHHHQLVEAVVVGAPQGQRVPSHTPRHLALYACSFGESLKLLLLVGIFCLQECALSCEYGYGAFGHLLFFGFPVVYVIALGGTQLAEVIKACVDEDIVPLDQLLDI